MVRKTYMKLRTQQANTDKSNCHKEEEINAQKENKENENGIVREH